jgi:hypothetical protein
MGASENEVLGTVFGYKEKEVLGGWENLHHHEFRNLQCSPQVTRMVQLRQM